MQKWIMRWYYSIYVCETGLASSYEHTGERMQGREGRVRGLCSVYHMNISHIEGGVHTSTIPYMHAETRSQRRTLLSSSSSPL
jgi:hypothetical protein